MPNTAKRPRSSVGVGILKSQNQCPTNNCLLLQISSTLCTPQLSLPLQALIDSGAEGYFIDRDLAIQSGLPLEALPEPCTTRALDGHILVQVTQATAPLKLVLSGNHNENISFKLISAPKTPIILGFPWLKVHNSHIDWAACRILSWSPYCLSTCLQSALPPTECAAAPLDSESLDLTNVPSEYRDLNSV